MNRGEFAREVFKQLSIPAQGRTLTFAVAWAEFEDTKAGFNPFATTEPFGASTDFNIVGVKNYANVKDGIDATVLTLTNGYYTNLIKVLRNANSTPAEMCNALDDSPWGSHPTMALFQEVEHNYDKYNIEVSGNLTIKENVVSEELYVKNEDGTFTKVGSVVAPPSEDVPQSPPDDSVEAPVEKTDTLVDRVAAQEAAARSEAAKAQAEVEAEAAKSPPERRVATTERRSNTLRRVSTTDTRVPLEGN